MDFSKIASSVASSPRYIDGIPVREVFEGVSIINAYDFTENIFPGVTFDNYPEYEEIEKRVEEWCKKNNGHYYARGRHEYDETEAVDEAKGLGKTVVIVEDLS